MAKLSLGKRPGSFKLNVTIPVPGADEPDTLEFTVKYRTRKELAEFTDQQSASSRARIDALLDRMKPQAAEAVETVAAAPAKKGRKAAPAESAALPKAPPDADFAQALNEGQADYILATAEAWELADELNRENVLQLVDRFPGALPAFVESYNKAIKEGRLGN